jgi:hypothetical protein
MKYAKIIIFLYSLSLSTQSFSMFSQQVEKIREQYEEKDAEIVVPYPKDMYNPQLYTQLEDALQNNNTEAIQSFFEKNKHFVNIADGGGATPLHKACQRGHTHLITLFLEQHNTNVNAQDEHGDTPLHDACYRNQKEAAELLLKHPNTNANIKNMKHETPLMCTPHLQSLLINNKKVNVQTKNNYGQTLLYLAYKDNNHHNIPYCDLWKIPYCMFRPNMTDEKRQNFMDNELYHAATMHTTGCQLHIIPSIDCFIHFCILQGANPNHRNKQNKRAIDIAEQEYVYAKKHLSWESDAFMTKEIIFHSFLEETPYISDKELHYILWKNRTTRDLIPKIMGYYSAITIERDVALYISKNPQRYLYTRNKIYKKNFRANLLAEKCNHLDYINPSAKKLR